MAYRKVRSLSPSELGVADQIKNAITNSSLESYISDDDTVYKTVCELLTDGYSGVILEGPPGTGKSWYAREISRKITQGIAQHALYIQFHPGFQYEDFVEGYIPDGNGGFKRDFKVFAKACLLSSNTDKPVVLIIDELSRVDVVRVFGEVLTYIEKNKRNLEFMLSSGNYFKVPDNLTIIATMNPWDRGVEELDLALERRFAKISIKPSVDVLKYFLGKSSLSEIRAQKLIQFFFIIANHSNPLCRIGHAYFEKISDDESLHRLWKYQLSFHFEKVLRGDHEELERIQTAWDRIFKDE